MMQRVFFQPVRPWLSAPALLCSSLLCLSFVSSPSQADATSSTTTVNTTVGPIFPDGGDVYRGYRNLWGYDRVPRYFDYYWRRYHRYYVQADWYQATPWYDGPNVFDPTQRRQRMGSATTTRQSPVGHPLLRGLNLDAETKAQARRIIAEHNRAETEAKQAWQQAIRDIWVLAKAAREIGDTEDYQNHLQTLRELSTKETVTPALIESLRSVIPEEQQPAFALNVSHALGTQAKAAGAKAEPQPSPTTQGNTEPAPTSPESKPD